MNHFKFLALLLICWGVVAESPRAAPAPDFSLPLGDSVFSLQRCRGKIVVLNFWATYCKPCLSEMPFLDSLWRANQKRGLVVVGISTDEDSLRDRIPSVVSQARASYVILHDNTSKVAKRYRVGSFIPVSFVVDEHGKIVKRVNGNTDSTRMRLAAIVDSLMPHIKQKPVLLFPGLHAEGSAAGVKLKADTALKNAMREYTCCHFIFADGDTSVCCDYLILGDIVRMSARDGVELIIRQAEQTDGTLTRYELCKSDSFMSTVLSVFNQLHRAFHTEKEKRK